MVIYLKSSKILQKVLCAALTLILVFVQFGYAKEWEVVNSAPIGRLQIKPMKNVNIQIGAGGGHTRDEIQGYVNSILTPRLYSNGIKANVSITDVYNPGWVSADKFSYYMYYETTLCSYDSATNKHYEIHECDTKYMDEWSDHLLVKLPSGRAYFYSTATESYKGSKLGIPPHENNKGEMVDPYHDVDTEFIFWAVDANAISSSQVHEVFYKSKGTVTPSNWRDPMVSDVQIDANENFYFTAYGGTRYMYNPISGTLTDITGNSSYGGIPINNCTSDESPAGSYLESEREDIDEDEGEFDSCLYFYKANGEKTFIDQERNAKSNHYHPGVYFLPSNNLVDYYLGNRNFGNTDGNFLVYVDSIYIPRYEKPGLYSSTSSKIKNYDADFIALGNSKNKVQLQNILGVLPRSAGFIDNTDMNSAFNKLADYVVNKVLGVNIIFNVNSKAYNLTNIASKLNSALVPSLKSNNIYSNIRLFDYNSFDNSYDNMNYLIYTCKIPNRYNMGFYMLKYNEATGEKYEYDLTNYVGDKTINSGSDDCGVYGALNINGYVFIWAGHQYDDDYDEYTTLIRVAPDGSIMTLISNNYADHEATEEIYVDMVNGWITRVPDRFAYFGGGEWGKVDCPNELYDLNGNHIRDCAYETYGVSLKALNSYVYSAKGRYYSFGSNGTNNIGYCNNTEIWRKPITTGDVYPGSMGLVPPYINDTKSLYSIVSSVDYKDSFNFVVTLDNGIIDEFQDYNKTGAKNNISNLCTGKGAKYVAIGSPTYQSSYNFMAGQACFGKFIDCTNVDTAINNLAAYIKQVVEDDNKDGIYILLGQEVVTTPYYADMENDPKYQEYWRTELVDPYYFKSPTYKGESLISDSSTPTVAFSNVGKYKVKYNVRDNPKADDRFDNYRKWNENIDNTSIVYVHRKPIADFTLISKANGSDYYIVNTVDNSYDLDHLGESGNGIVAWEWQWQYAGSTWNSGRISNLNVYKNTTVIQRLRVKDKEGAWSDWVQKSIDINGIKNNNPPIAKFSIDTIFYPAKALNINDLSSDPDGDPIVERKWKILNSGNTLLKDCGTQKPTTQDLVNLGQKQYIISLEVRDDPTGRNPTMPSLWSTPFYQTIDAATNHAPVADFTVAEWMYQGDVNTITDKSYDYDGDPLQYHWWILDNNQNVLIDCWGTKPDSYLSSLNEGHYFVKLIVNDVPKVGSTLSSTPCIKPVEIVKASSLMTVDIIPRTVPWTNKPINVDVKVYDAFRYNRTYYMWSKSANTPSADTIKASGLYNTSTDFTATLSNTKANEGQWYLHVLAKDLAKEVYDYGGTYNMDITPPDIGFNSLSMMIDVSDALSGVKETYYMWSSTAEPTLLTDLTGFSKWDGSSEIMKPEGPPLYIHVKSFDNAGNEGYKVFGPIQDPLKLTNFRIISMVNPPYNYTFPIYQSGMPVEAKSGYRNSFEIDVQGKADSITVSITDSNGNNWGNVSMTKTRDIDAYHSVWGFSHAPDLDIPKGTIIKYYIVGQRSTVTYDYNAKNSWNGDTIRIIGSALEDTRIYRKY